MSDWVAQALAEQGMKPSMTQEMIDAVNTDLEEFWNAHIGKPVKRTITDLKIFDDHVVVTRIKQFTTSIKRNWRGHKNVEGERNAKFSPFMLSEIYRLEQYEFTEDEILAYILQRNQVMNVPPLPEREVICTFYSAIKKWEGDHERYYAQLAEEGKYERRKYRTRYTIRDIELFEANHVVTVTDGVPRARNIHTNKAQALRVALTIFFRKGDVDISTLFRRIVNKIKRTPKGLWKWGRKVISKVQNVAKKPAQFIFGQFAKFTTISRYVKPLTTNIVNDNQFNRQ
jgi:hypothetical protein